MEELLIVSVDIAAGQLNVILSDGTSMAVPLRSFPRLARAGVRQRATWRLIGGGVGVHWPLVDEDVSIENILRAHSRQGEMATGNQYLSDQHGTVATAPMLRETRAPYRTKRRRRLTESKVSSRAAR